MLVHFDKYVWALLQGSIQSFSVTWEHLVGFVEKSGKSLTKFQQENNVFVKIILSLKAFL